MELEVVLAIAGVVAVLIVSVASVVGSIANARLRARNGLRKDWLGNEIPIERNDSGEHKALLREVEELRDRVRVLERIATDKRTQLADEIEDLRDQRSN
jgi:hypothetical protein